MRDARGGRSSTPVEPWVERRRVERPRRAVSTDDDEAARAVSSCPSRAPWAPSPRSCERLPAPPDSHHTSFSASSFLVANSSASSLHISSPSSCVFSPHGALRIRIHTNTHLPSPPLATRRAAATADHRRRRHDVAAAAATTSPAAAGPAFLSPLGRAAIPRVEVKHNKCSRKRPKTPHGHVSRSQRPRFAVGAIGDVRG